MPYHHKFNSLVIGLISGAKELIISFFGVKFKYFILYKWIGIILYSLIFQTN